MDDLLGQWDNGGGTGMSDNYNLKNNYTNI